MQLAGYTNLTKFAEGGMSTLYKGHQVSLNRTVVIKLISVQAFWDKTSKMLFEQEALVIAKLSHPNIVHIIDRGTTDRGRPFFVMEYIKGMNLADFMKVKKLNVQSKINILMNAAKGIAFAHKNNVIHRDIKPANLLINTSGHVQVLDFGIAWICNVKQDPNSEVMGTPDYMSPEQFSSPFDITHLSDVYSFGVVMYELFMHKLPTEHLEDISLSMDFVPPSVARLVEQCLELRPELRPPSMDEVRVRLLKSLKGFHISDTQRKAATKDIGQSIDKFVLLDVIKHDNFGAVYLSEDQSNKSLIVIKKCTNTRAGFDEARLLAKINHSSIIKILGTSKNKNSFIVVMQHMSGGNLQERLITPYLFTDFIKIAQQIATAMQVAHEHKITHKNLRPSNILFDEHDKIKVTDFGFDEHYSENENVKGWYQAPRYFGSDQVNDIYSAGSIFFQMLTGEHLTLSNKKIVANHLFLKLSKAEQNLIQNMVEKDAPGRHVSFKGVNKNINEVIRYKKRQPYIRLFKRIMLYCTTFILSLIAVYFLQPELFDELITQSQLLLDKLNQTP